MWFLAYTFGNIPLHQTYTGPWAYYISFETVWRTGSPDLTFRKCHEYFIFYFPNERRWTLEEWYNEMISINVLNSEE